MRFPLGRQNAAEQQDRIFEAQKNIIQFLAKRQSCIIVGRCADFIPADLDHVMNVYICAGYQNRLAHCMNDLGLTEAEGRRMIKSVDEARKAYHLNYAGYLPGDPAHMDIIINSGFLGIDGTAEYLAGAVIRKFGLSRTIGEHEC